MPERTSTPKPRKLLRAGSAALVLLGLAAYFFVHYHTGSTRPPYCAVTTASADEPYTLQPQQAANAATIQAVASARELPERAVTIAIATAMQESSLRNIEYGDRDSLGLFQQRPSMGWGTPQEIMDPVYASGRFYDHLVEIPGYTEMPLTEAAQAVQRSAFPDEYAKHEPQADLLTAALTGREAASLSCTASLEPAPGDPVEISDRMTYEFGMTVRPENGTGRISVPIPGTEPSRRGWELAHWAVAHATELGIVEIGYQDRVWRSDRSTEGWRVTDASGSSAELLLSVAG
jgi:hypothetical protein